MGMAGKKAHWYDKHGLKQVSGFLKPKRRHLLRQIMLDTTDLTSLTRYITLILERHIHDYLQAKSSVDNSDIR